MVPSLVVPFLHHHPCFHPYCPFLLPYHLLGSMVPSLVVPFLHHHPCFHPGSKEKVPCQVHPSFLLWVPFLPFLSSKVLCFLACSYFLSCFPWQKEVLLLLSCYL